MPQLTIVPHGDSAAVVLPASVLASIGAQIGDVLEATPGDRQLLLRTTEAPSRKQVVEKITEEVFAERGDAYRRLA